MDDVVPPFKPLRPERDCQCRKQALDGIRGRFYRCLGRPARRRITGTDVDRHDTLPWGGGEKRAHAIGASIFVCQRRHNLDICKPAFRCQQKLPRANVLAPRKTSLFGAEQDYRDPRLAAGGAVGGTANKPADDIHIFELLSREARDLCVLFLLPHIFYTG